MSVKIDDLLVTATAHFASDLHLKAGSFPIMRIGGELYPVADAPKLCPEDTLDMAFSMMSNRQKQKLKEVSEVDIALQRQRSGAFSREHFSATRHGEYRAARDSRSEQDFSGARPARCD